MSFLAGLSRTAHAATEGLQNPLGGDVNSITDFLVIVLYNLVLPIGSVVIVIMIIYSGFLFVTARGNATQIERARGIFFYVIIGAAILLGATVISFAIEGTLCQIAPDLPNCAHLVGPPADPTIR